MINQRVNKVFQAHYQELVKKTDHMFGFLFVFQWLLGIAFAYYLAPKTWSGEFSETHIHIFAAIFLGGAIAALPVYLIISAPGAQINRMLVAVSQILFSVLFIHLTGGRIETHFHIFGSLAFLAFYRDWRVVVIATAITAVDHLVRGYFWPQSVYGVLSATPWRAFEHAAWVIFEDLILFYSIKLALSELYSVSEAQVKLQDAIASVEDQVIERTRELLASQKVVAEQQQAVLASAKMSALGEMAGGVAHEINNPLAAIKNISGQLQEVVDDDPLDRNLVKELASDVEKTTNRIAKIVQGLRTFSRDGSNDPFYQVNIHKLIEETLSFCGERFKSNGTKLIVGDFANDLTFEGRETEISQVLLNLLNNAHDAIAKEQDRWIKVEVLNDEHFIEIHVTDCGKGISQEVRDKMFQPFFTTKEIGKGTGMGLSISSGIVRKHGGELWLNTESKNTSFVVRLPKRHTVTSVA